jgi:hypothetical protein
MMKRSPSFSFDSDKLVAVPRRSNAGAVRSAAATRRDSVARAPVRGPETAPVDAPSPRRSTVATPPKRATPALTPQDLTDPLWMKIGAFVFYALCALVVWWGWEVRDQHYMSAKFGVGYMLGIVGTTLMALLLLYPARKRARAFRNLGPIKYWFRVHMIFGVIGPMLVVFHCNFSLGSFNSQTVLFCTLIVSFSGFFGRYFYARIHHGLYGRKANLDELQKDFVDIRDKGSAFAQFLPTIMEDLARVERPLLSPTGKLQAGMATAMFAGITTHWANLRIRMKLGDALDAAATASPIVARERERLETNCRRYVAGRLRQLRAYAQFMMFERLFSIWHVVHYPLFIVLVAAVIVHIIAVHMY